MFVNLIGYDIHCCALFKKKKDKERRNMFGVVRCGGRGFLCEPRLGHPFSLRDQ